VCPAAAEPEAVKGVEVSTDNFVSLPIKNHALGEERKNNEGLGGFGFCKKSNKTKQSQ